MHGLKIPSLREKRQGPGGRDLARLPEGCGLGSAPFLSRQPFIFSRSIFPSVLRIFKKYGLGSARPESPWDPSFSNHNPDLLYHGLSFFFGLSKAPYCAFKRSFPSAGFIFALSPSFCSKIYSSS